MLLSPAIYKGEADWPPFLLRPFAVMASLGGSSSSCPPRLVPESMQVLRSPANSFLLLGCIFGVCGSVLLPSANLIFFAMVACISWALLAISGQEGIQRKSHGALDVDADISRTSPPPPFPPTWPRLEESLTSLEQGKKSYRFHLSLFLGSHFWQETLSFSQQHKSWYP